MKAIKSLFILSVLFTTALSAYANSKLNGVAAYQELGREIFLAALYNSEFNSPDSILNIEQDLKLEVRATRSITKRRWVNMWMQGIAINNRQETFEAEAENLVALFDAFQAGLKNGDIFTLSYSSATGATATLDGVELVTGQSWDFFRLFLQAWIGPVPPSTDFKSAILGNQASPDLALRLPTITPAAERIGIVTAWLTPEEEESVEEVAIEPIEEPEIATPEIAVVEPEVKQEPIEEEIIEEELPEEEVVISVESLIAQQEYTTSVIKKIYSSLKYPKTAIKRNMQGSVRVQLQVQRDGSVLESLLAEESKHNILNKAAIKAVNKAAPFSPIPSAVTEDLLEFSIPVVFKLTD